MSTSNLSHTNNKNSLKNSRASSLLSAVQRENELLHQAIAVRDQQIASLHATIVSCGFSLNETKGQKSGSFVLQLSQHLQNATSINQQYRRQIDQLYATIRKNTSQHKAQQNALRQQIQNIKKDLQYRIEQHERVIDNMEVIHLHMIELRIAQRNSHYQNIISIMQQEMQQVRRDSFDKKCELERLNQKIKQERHIAGLRKNELQLRNQGLNHTITKVQQNMRKQMKIREQQFQQVLGRIHKEQTQQIVSLCQRIDFLKKQLQNKEETISQLWKARDLQAKQLFRMTEINQSKQLSKIGSKQLSKTKNSFCSTNYESMDIDKAKQGLQKFMRS